MALDRTLLFSEWHAVDADARYIYNISDAASYNDSSIYTLLYDTTTADSAEEPLSTWLIVLIALLAAGTSLTTVSGNLIVLLSFFLERSIRQPTNYFIASLALSDLLIGAVSMPFYTVYLLKGHHWPLGEILCDLWLSVDYTVCLCSIYTVFCITIDRFCSVKLPAKYREWRTERKVLALVGFTWVVPMLVFFPSIFGWQGLVGERTIPSGKCYVQYMEDALFNCLLQVGYFWVTLCVMCALYAAIYRVALNLELKSGRKRSKATSSFVSIAGQKFAQIGVGLTDSGGQRADGVTRPQRGLALAGEPDIATKQINNCVDNADKCSSPDYPSDVDSANGTPLHAPNDGKLKTGNVSPRKPTSPRPTLHAMLQTCSQATSQTTSQIVSQATLSRASPTPLHKAIHVANKNIDSLEACEVEESNRMNSVQSNCVNCDKNGKIINPHLRIATNNDNKSNSLLPSANSKLSSTCPIFSQKLDDGNTSSDIDPPDSASPVHGNGGENFGRCFGTSTGRRHRDKVRLIIKPRDSIDRHRRFPREPVDENPVWRRRDSFSERSTLMPLDSIKTNYDALSATTSHNYASNNINRAARKKPTPVRLYSRLMTLYKASRNTTTSRLLSENDVLDSPRSSTRVVPGCAARSPQTADPRAAELIELHEDPDRRSMQIGILSTRRTSRTAAGGTTTVSTTSFYTALVTRRDARTNGSQSPSSKKSKSANRAKKALRTITIILGAFVVCWTPWHVLSMMIGFCTAKDTSVCVPPVLYDISYWLCYLNSPLNPFCYALANQQFKKTFTRILRLDWHRTG